LGVRNWKFGRYRQLGIITVHGSPIFCSTPSGLEKRVMTDTPGCTRGYVVQPLQGWMQFIVQFVSLRNLLACALKLDLPYFTNLNIENLQSAIFIDLAVLAANILFNPFRVGKTCNDRYPGLHPGLFCSTPAGLDAPQTNSLQNLIPVSANNAAANKVAANPNSEFRIPNNQFLIPTSTNKVVAKPNSQFPITNSYFQVRLFIKCRMSCCKKLFTIPKESALGVASK